MKDKSYLLCPECTSPVFVRDADHFESGERELCEECGTTAVVFCDGESPATAEEGEPPIAEIRRLRAALDVERERAQRISAHASKLAVAMERIASGAEIDAVGYAGLYLDVIGAVPK